MVLLSDAVGATPRNRGLQIAQQPETTQQNATRAAAERVTQEGMQLQKEGTGESLRQAIGKWQEALKLWQQVDDKGWEANILLGIGKVYYSLGEKQEALKYLNQALPIYRAVGDRRGEAYTLNNIGLVYKDLGEKQEALKYLNQALPIFRAVGDRRGEAITLNNIGLVYNDLGEKQEALKYFNQALPILRAVEYKGGEAYTLNNIGNVYSSLGEKQEALKYFNQALPILRAVEDKGGEATTLNNIGSIYSNLGEKQEALKYFNQALPILRAVEDKGGEATTLSNIGGVYSSLGEKQEALKYYNQALPITRAVGDRGGEATTLNNIGIIYSDLGEKQEALKYYNQALPITRAVGDRGVEATTLNNIGIIYSDLGEKQEALKYYNQALPIFRAVGDRGGEATTLNNIGNVYSSLGEKQEALKYYNQALPITRAVEDRGGEATTLNNIGLVYSDLGEKQEALKYYNQALPILRAVGDRGGEAMILYNMANLERDRGNLQQAQTHIQAAIKIIEDLRTKIDSKELRTSYFATVQDYYQFYIDLLMQLHKKYPTKVCELNIQDLKIIDKCNALALHISERSRARGLVELLTEANVDIRKGADPKLLAEERQLQWRIDAREKLLSELFSKKESPAQLVATTKQQIEDLLKQQQELKTKFRNTNSEYAGLKYPEPLTFPQIQQQLDQDSLLLQYSLGKERSYLWLVTPNSLNSYELPNSEKIKKAATNLNQLLTRPLIAGASPEEKAQSVTDTTKAAQELSQLIIAPVAKKLGKKRLVIVADGILHQIPFAVLSDLTPQPPSLQGKGEQDQLKLPSPLRRGVGGEVNYQPLLVNHEIVNLPSVTSLATQRQQLKGRKMAPKTLAVLADPVFSANDERVTGKAPQTSSSLDIEVERSALQRSLKNINRSGLDRLPGTRQEAEVVLKMVSPSESFHAFDFDANYNLATSKQLNQYRLLLFATHGIFDNINPELSGIAMSLIDKQGKFQKGFLRLNDIFNLDLPAELIVLSACETGLGQEVKGEGLVGLTRGLMYAGSPRVIVSLWKVDDQATSLLMEKLYKQILQQDKSPAVALREAQLKLWQQKDWQNPRYWAAFTVQGEWRSK